MSWKNVCFCSDVAQRCVGPLVRWYVMLVSSAARQPASSPLCQPASHPMKAEEGKEGEQEDGVRGGGGGKGSRHGEM